MAKKIVVLNGSPRPSGNTAALIKAFTEGARQVGHEVDVFALGQMKVNGCLGCWKGGKDPAHPCVQKDDMDKIYPAYMAADVVVLASPLYYWGLSGQLKTVFDRLFAVAEMNENYANPQKGAVLLMAAEGNGYEETVYWYERVMQHIHWQDLGRVLACNVLQPGDIEGKPELEEARTLGAGL